MNTDTHEIRPDDVFGWLEIHGWQIAETEQWGEVAFHPRHGGGGAVRKSRSGHVVAADVAHGLGVKAGDVLRGVQRGWSPCKVQCLAAVGE